MTAHREQPEPARPVTPSAPAWLRYVSEVGEDELPDLLTAKQKADASTPGLQRALLAAAIVAAAATIAAVAVFNVSHFRVMDVQYGVDARGNHIGGEIDYSVAGVALAVLVGALLVYAGSHFDVTRRTRAVLMTIGALVMIAVGGGIGLLLDPSRGDLQAHYHVGEWGSKSSFDGLIFTLDALGWIIAVCGIVVLALMVVQRRRVLAAFPE